MFNEKDGSDECTSSQPSYTQGHPECCSGSNVTSTARLLKRNLSKEFLQEKPPQNGNESPAYDIESSKVFELANDIFGYDGWSHSILEQKLDYESEKDGKYTAAYTTQVRVEISSSKNFHEDMGYAVAENKSTKFQASEAARKNSVDDGVKRALRFFGNALGNCLSDPDYLLHVLCQPTVSSQDCDDVLPPTIKLPSRTNRQNNESENSRRSQLLSSIQLSSNTASSFRNSASTESAQKHRNVFSNHGCCSTTARTEASVSPIKMEYSKNQNISPTKYPRYSYPKSYGYTSIKVSPSQEQNAATSVSCGYTSIKISPSQEQNVATNVNHSNRNIDQCDMFPSIYHHNNNDQLLGHCSTPTKYSNTNANGVQVDRRQDLKGTCATPSKQQQQHTPQKQRVTPLKRKFENSPGKFNADTSALEVEERVKLGELRKREFVNKYQYVKNKF